MAFRVGYFNNEVKRIVQYDVFMCRDHMAQMMQDLYKLGAKIIEIDFSLKKGGKFYLEAMILANMIIDSKNFAKIDDEAITVDTDKADIIEIINYLYLFIGIVKNCNHSLLAKKKKLGLFDVVDSLFEPFRRDLRFSLTFPEIIRGSKKIGIRNTINEYTRSL